MKLSLPAVAVWQILNGWFVPLGQQAICLFLGLLRGCVKQSLIGPVFHDQVGRLHLGSDERKWNPCPDLVDQDLVAVGVGVGGIGQESGQTLITENSV